MEPSPLVRAHDHALAAAVATRQSQFQSPSSDTTVAVSEHTHAAGEFANAARSTSSVEALRTLKLLEEHHRKLAELLSLPPDHATQQQQQHSTDHGGDATSEKLPSVGEEGDPAATAESPSSKKETASSETASTRASQKTGLPQQRRIPSREMSSSIASNLASARGIRSSKYRGQPLSPSISNDQAPGNVDAHPRRDGSKTKMQNIIEHQTVKPSWTPPMPAAPSSRSTERRERKVQVPEEPETAAAEDAGGYAKFYNTFGSLMNRISAPLAFAGLPLIQEESNQSEEPEMTETQLSKRNSHPRTTPATSQDVDLSKIYSKATMRAFVKDGHGTSDSFYVVPTSGHTMSYANILSYAKKEERRLGSHHGLLGVAPEDDDDDFVDARETPVPLSPDARRRLGRARTERELHNTIEELYTENQSLKDLLDKLTKRLHLFESSAQNMAESFRIMRPGSPLSGGSKDRLRDREIDEEFLAMKRQIEKLEKENKKLLKTVEKYREKWETLKAGAKARREAQGTLDVEDSGPT